jgi:GMP synthase (glutamine-hydrolysing)
LATGDHTRVQALEVKHGKGTFWSTQYHPEFNLREMGRLIAARAKPLTQEGFFAKEEDVAGFAAQLEALHNDPQSASLRETLKIGDDILDPTIREVELRNWVDHLVLPEYHKR